MKLKSLSALGSRMLMYRFFRAFPQWKEFETDRMKYFSNIIREFHKDYIQAVTEERYGVELPLNMGKHFIIAYKSKRNYPRFKGPMDRDPGIYTNTHTDGLKCKLIYTNHEKRYRVKDRYVFSFKPEVGFKKAVSKAFAADHTKFIFNTDNSPINERKRDMENKDALKARIAKFLLTYDEFEIN